MPLRMVPNTTLHANAKRVVGDEPVDLSGMGNGGELCTGRDGNEALVKRQKSLSVPAPSHGIGLVLHHGPSFQGPFCAKVGIALLKPKRPMVDPIGSPFVVARHAPVGHQGHRSCATRLAQLQGTLPRHHAPWHEGVKRVGPHVDSDLTPLGIEAWFLVPLLGRLHHIQPCRQGRFGKHGLPHHRHANALVTGNQELPSRRRDPLPLGLRPHAAVRPTQPRLAEGRPFLKRQTQVRLGQRAPTVGVGRGKLAALVPRTRHFVFPASIPWVFVACPAQHGGHARGVLHGQAHFQEAIVGGQISLQGKSDDPGKETLFHIRGPHGPGHSAAIAGDAFQAKDSMARPPRGVGKRCRLQVVDAPQVGEASLRHLGWTQTRPRTTRHANGRPRRTQCAMHARQPSGCLHGGRRRNAWW